MSSQAIDQAISFLTTPLSRTTVSASALSVLQAHLFASLTALTNSARRTSSASNTFEIRLRLASSTPPPECIARACEASGVNWSEWLFLIGGGMGLDLDVNIRHNAVTASFSRAGTPSLGLVTVWQQEEPQQLTTRELLYADDDSEDLFNEINRSQHSPSWLSSWSTTTAAPGVIYPKQPSALAAPMSVPKMQPVPANARTHSRSSSFASNSSSSNHSCGGPSYGFNGYSLSPSNPSANVNGVIGSGMERAGSSCSQRSRSSGSNASGSPPTSIYSLSEDGSSGSSGGALSWTRRGTVIPGPQQSAIMAARQAHQQQQQMQAYPGVPMINVEQTPAHYQQGHRSSPSISSNASAASGSSGGHGKHRRQRSNANVVIDPSKSNVTAYDGGKTKVMTGGVMLGSVNSGKRKGQ
ncbi:hypothetical protein PIIN_10478 [Serendipita indica DSM 11827]|uniref:Anti-proliferative protein domain-containing protein n=1 Tax=Serendipita indica (strain DSM 11827) TaxID=1109443 RepID=G4TYU2_SERID|nr:hypothetical protein PIIN_10478 [Serendipita indica DSM 11827]